MHNNSSGSYDYTNGQSNYSSGNNQSGSGESSGSGSSGQGDQGENSEPDLYDRYNSVRYGVPRWDAPDLGFDLVGTTSDSGTSTF